MPTPIQRITTEQFALLAVRDQFKRTIAAIHVHHTRRPRRDDFRGLATIEAMREYHVKHHGWNDIAQHLTIDPQGGLWTGRSWNSPPASAAGHNGDAGKGPFMIEIVGDFDEGHDPFDGPQREATYAVVGHLLRTFELPDTAIKFHSELANRKTCPGTGIDRAAFVAAARAAADARPRRAPARPFRLEYLLGADTLRAAVDPTDTAATGTVPEDAAAGAAIERAAAAARAGVQERARRAIVPLAARASFDRSRAAEDWAVLKPHVINLAKGELSQGGDFQTTPADVRALVDAIRDYTENTAEPRLVIHAHGGLVSESSALGYAKTMYRWWLNHGVYPVFFIWESSFLEILGQYVLGRRDIFDWTSDLAIEALVKGPGTGIWAGMKDSARRASAEDLGDGSMGGARLFARKLGGWMASSGAPLRVHAIGHSAGAIFHAHLLPALLAERVPQIDHLYLLAPAARVELFKQQLAGPLAGGQISRLSMFTMEEEAEEQDNCWRAYRKSLLYLVSHACEGIKRRPILGLHRSIRKDAELRRLFDLQDDGSQGPAAAAALHFSFAKGKPENPLTCALAHGAFDNDPKTMSAVLRRIRDLDDSTGIGEADFPYPPLSRAFDWPLPTGPAASSPPPPDRAPAAPGTPLAPAGGGPRIKALCIGIDEYPERPLAGCVNDARTWGGVLTQLGASVTYLLNEQADDAGMREAIRAHVRGASPGDVLVLQYSGHGGQVPRRVDSEADGFNEALIPIDYDSGALLVDDELAELLADLPAGASITLFMDCCHSGTNSRFAPLVRARAAGGDRPRFMPLDDDIIERYFARRGARAVHRGAEMSLPGVVHFAACQDHEFAWESAGQGDFTAAAAPALAAAVAGRTTNEQFAAAVAARVAVKNRQHPQIMQLAPGMSGRALLARVS